MDIKFSKYGKLPYFNDSSFDYNAIRISRELIPIMKQIFSDNIYFKLNIISSQSKQLESLIQNKVNCYMKNENIIVELRNILEAKIPISISVFAFIDSLKNHIYKLNHNLPSHKSVYNMLNIIINKHNKNVKQHIKKIKIILSTNCYGYYDLENMKLVLYFSK